MGDGGSDLWVLSNQGRPLSGVAFEILDRRHERGISALREGLEEGQLPLVMILFGDEALHVQARPGHQVRGPALDQKQEGVGPPGGQAREEHFPIGKQVHLVRGHCRR